MSELITGLVAAGFGVLLGRWLGIRDERRRHLRKAARQVASLCLETVAQFHLIEVERNGGPAAPPIRPELTPELYGALVLIRDESPGLATAAERLTDAIRDATAAQADPDTDRRAAARQSAMAAIEEFRGASHEAAASPWRWSCSSSCSNRATRDAFRGRPFVLVPVPGGLQRTI